MIDSGTMNTIKHELIIPEDYKGRRLDSVIAELLPDYSRSRLQQWIKSGHLLVNNKSAKAKDKVHGQEVITINAPLEAEINNLPQDIPLDIIYADDDVIVINKPVGLVAHPAAGNPDGTLLNALLFHFPELANMPRAGIIHRLDKDTSGILIVARSLPAHTKLVDALQKRHIKRDYIAIVQGEPTGGGTVETYIGRHPTNRIKMAVTDDGKLARTHYRIGQRLLGHTLLNVSLDTGRTHQIRVHMAHLKHPIVGDLVYGKLRFPKNAAPELITYLQHFKRQALHAHKIGFEHPITGEHCDYTAPLPDDMQQLIALLSKHHE